MKCLNNGRNVICHQYIFEDFDYLTKQQGKVLMCKDEKISVKTSIFTDSIIKSLRIIQTLNILWQQKATLHLYLIFYVYPETRH